jgi:hypothetical protein
MNILQILASTLSLSVSTTVPAQAIELKGLLQHAIDLDRESKQADALGALKKAEEDYAASVPLTMKKMVFVAFPSKGFEGYVERTNTTYQVGERINVYLEPIGLMWKSIGNGLYRPDITLDFKVTSDDQNFVLQRNNLPFNSLPAREASMDFFLNFYLDTMNYAAGGYTLELTVHDLIKHQTTVGKGKFTIHT